MKSAVFNQYGNHTQLHTEDIEIPKIKADQVLVKVMASSINKSDQMMLEGKPFFLKLMNGLSKPKHRVLGADVAGIVEKVGTEIQGISPGDEVICDLGDAPRYGYSEYAPVPQDKISKKPSHLSFEEAAALPLAGGTALKGLKMGKIKSGMKVLVIGASGGVGSLGVILAKAYGCHVTAAVRTKKIETIKAIGADAYFDIEREDITKASGKFDLILDTACFRNFKDYNSILNPGGCYSLTGGDFSQILKINIFGKSFSKKNKKQFKGYLYTTDKNSLDELSELISGSGVKPQIDKVFNLENVSEAFKYYEAGRTTGKVVISIKGGE